MRRLSVLLSHDLGYAYGDKERGPNGRKKIFLNTGKAFLRALAKDLGLRDALVSANEGGIAVSGECTLIGMWEEGGIYICLSQPVGGGDKVLLYRTVRNGRDYKGGYLIKSGSQSAAVMDRWVLKVRALEEKKRHYEGVLQRELDGLDDEFSVLKFLSQELQIRANSIRSQRFQQRAA